MLAVLALAGASFVVGTLVEPLHWMYAPLCHQLAARSLDVGGITQAVCARCAGLYVGGVAGLACAALWIPGRRRRLSARWLAYACAPSLADWGLGALLGIGLSNVPRFVLAWPAGFVAALFLALAVEELTRSGPRLAVRPSEVLDG